MKKLAHVLAAVLVLLARAGAQARQDTVRFETSDGCVLEAFYQQPSSGSYVFINAHGLGSSKNEWASFQEELKKAGYGYLSLDLRGHNASTVCGGVETTYRNFSKTDWNNASRDITAAAAWLEAKGISPGRQIFCGASIGANLSLKAVAEGARKPAAVVLLSPGLEYAGVNIKDYFTAPVNYPVLVAASDNDPYSWRSSAQLINISGANGPRPDFLNGKGGHGVNMFKNPGILNAVVKWVKKKVGR